MIQTLSQPPISASLAAQATMELKASSAPIYLSDLVTGMIYNKESSVIQVEIIAKGIAQLDEALGAEILKTGSYTIVMGAQMRSHGYELTQPAQRPLNPQLGYGPGMVRRESLAIFGDVSQRGVLVNIPTGTFLAGQLLPPDTVAYILQLLCYKELDGKFGFRQQPDSVPPSTDYSNT